MEETTQTPKKRVRKPAPKKTAPKKTRKPRGKKKVDYVSKVKAFAGKLNYRDLALVFLVADAAIRLFI